MPVELLTEHLQLQTRSNMTVMNVGAEKIYKRLMPPALTLADSDVLLVVEVTTN